MIWHDLSRVEQSGELFERPGINSERNQERLLKGVNAEIAVIFGDEASRVSYNHWTFKERVSSISKSFKNFMRKEVSKWKTKSSHDVTANRLIKTVQVLTELYGF